MVTVAADAVVLRAGLARELATSLESDTADGDGSLY
jgi:hypothetical protein